MEATLLNIISASKLEQVLQQSALDSNICLLLYDKFGQLIMRYPAEIETEFDAQEIATQVQDADEADGVKISPDLSLFSQAILYENQIIARLATVFCHSCSGVPRHCSGEEYIRKIGHLTKRRIEEIIDFQIELESISAEIIHNYDDMNLLYESSAMLAGIQDIEQASAKIIENAIAIIKADGGSVLLANEDKKELYITYTSGQLDFYPRAIKYGKGFCGLAAVQRKTILVDNVEKLSFIGSEPASFSPPLIACPMMVKDRLIGVITLARQSTGDTFTSMNLKLLEALASQSAVAFMNMQLFSDLVDKNKQLQDALENLQATQEQLIESQRLSAMGQLVASVAHDINNPLTGIVGYSELLLMNDKIEGKLREMLEIIHKEGERATGIVRNLKTFAQKCVSERQRVNINHLIQDILYIVPKTLDVKHIQITTDLDSNLPETIADSGQIQQILINLLTNAAEAMHGSGSIEIKTEVVDERISQSQQIRLSISDDGPGIPPEIQSRVFEPFFSTKREVKGTGLGLSICHSIIAAHKGRIYLESEVGTGTTFYIELPTVSQKIEVDCNCDENNLASTAKAPGKRILVVDDEPLVQSLLKDILISQGYSVEVACDGEEALSKLEETDYDLFMLDVIMPKINGIEFYNRMMRIFPKQDLKDKVVFITGDTSSEKIRLFLAQKELNYIAKPFRAEDLCKKVNEMLASIDSKRIPTESAFGDRAGTIFQ